MHTQPPSSASLRLAWALYAVPMVVALGVTLRLHASGALPLRAAPVFASVLPGCVVVAALRLADPRVPPPHVAATVLWGFLVCACCVAVLPGTSQRLYDTFHIRPELAWKVSRAVVVPMAEEAAKALGVVWALSVSSRRSWSAGFISASLVGVGFGVFENIVFYNRGGVSWAMVGVRLPGTYMHSVFTSCFGALLGLLWARGVWVRLGLGAVGWLVASVLHGSSNTITSAERTDVSGISAAVAWLAALVVIGGLERKRRDAMEPPAERA